jgi:hypothetical protein
MTSPNPSSEPAMTTLCTKRITALEANVNAAATIEVGGKTYTRDAAIAFFQASLDAGTNATTKKTEAAAAIVARRDADKKARAFDKGLKSWASTKFAAGTTAAKDFGVVPRTTVKTPDVLVIAAAKAKATRAARGTKGPKKKLEIMGVIPAAGAPATPATPIANAVPVPTITITSTPPKA